MAGSRVHQMKFEMRVMNSTIYINGCFISSATYYGWDHCIIPIYGGVLLSGSDVLAFLSDFDCDLR